MDDLQRLRSEAAQIECLYELDGLLRDFNGPGEALYARILVLLPRGFRFPDSCKASINVGDEVYTNTEVKDTHLRISEAIRSDGKPVGTVSLSYLRPMRLEKGVFLASEKRYLRSVADKIGDHLLIRQLRETIREIGDRSPEPKGVALPEPLVTGLEAMGMPVKELVTVLQQPVQFHKGEMFNKQGSDNPYLYLLAEGYIRNYIETGADRKLVFKIVSPVDWIGTPLVSGRSSLFFSSVALTDAMVYPVHKDDIMSLSGGVDGIIHQRFLASMEKNFSRISRLMTSQALGRVAIVLRYLSETVFAAEFIPAVISRRDIADMAGMSTESAVRMLSVLRNDKIISSSSKGIEILDTRMLKTISQAG